MGTADEVDQVDGSDQQDAELGPFTWVDLIDVRAGARVLLIDSGNRRAEASLLATRGQVTTATPKTWRREVGRSFDLICLDGVGIPPSDSLRQMREILAPEGRMVLCLDNRTSPLRAADRRRNGSDISAPEAGVGLRPALRSLSGADLQVRQRFVLLRSSNSPATAFDLMSRSSVRAVATATLSHVGGLRGRLVGALPRMPSTLIDRLAPAWLIIADRGVGGPDPDRIIGKVANRDSEEVKLIRGDPPSVLERCYLRRTPETAAEVSALTAAEKAGFSLAPRIVGTSQETRVAVTYLTGTPLVAASLSDAEVLHWIGRAARALGTLQRSTREADGTVLVHGDLWLGNLLVSGAEITGIVDWTSARRGAADIDQRFLIESLDHHREVSDAMRERIEATLAAGLRQGQA
ncbi:hypothetical protein GCM10027020_34480 [Nocardioides salsibiostraticola]